jgi:calcium-dependent protein kinase
MMCGQPPFNGDSDEDIIKKVKSGKYSMNDPVWRKRSDECKDLVVKMMTVDPKKRITSKEALNHPWI